MEEKRRNSMLADLLFISCSHTLAPSVFSFYDKYALLTGPARSEVQEDIDPRARFELGIQIPPCIGPWYKYLFIDVHLCLRLGVISWTCICTLLGYFTLRTLLITIFFWLSMCSGNMNGSMYLCEGEACPAMFTSPVDGLPNITNNQVL